MTVVLLLGCVVYAAFANRSIQADRLPEGELRAIIDERLPTGASEAQVLSVLIDLSMSNARQGATLNVLEPDTVAQEQCAPRPCSLVDRGVAPGSRAIAVRVEFAGGVWPIVTCREEYLVYFVLEDGTYTRLMSGWRTGCFEI